MNTMSRNQKIAWVASVILSVILIAFINHVWGWIAAVIYLILMLMESVNYYSRYEIERRYWRKPVWRCDYCAAVIDDDAEVIINFVSGGRTKRYDKSECMSAGIKGGHA